MRHLDRHQGGELEVLMERGGQARAGDFTPVRIDAPARPGALVRASITGHDGQALTAIPLEAAI